MFCPWIFGCSVATFSKLVEVELFFRYNTSGTLTTAIPTRAPTTNPSIGSFPNL